MLAGSDPRQTYRRIELDARVAGAEPAQLVAVCLEELIGALSSALYAAEACDNLLKSRSFTRAIAALTALQLGIDHQAPLARPLAHFYRAARERLLDCVAAFDRGTLQAIRSDMIDLAAAFRS